jgi:hypothetical protein
MEERPKSCVCCDQNMRFSILIPDWDDEKRSASNGARVAGKFVEGLPILTIWKSSRKRMTTP